MELTAREEADADRAYWDDMYDDERDTDPDD